MLANSSSKLLRPPCFKTSLQFPFSTTQKSSFKDTIYALSTGWGKSAISVIRVSGPNALDALSLTTKAESRPSLKPRMAHYRTFYEKQQAGEVVEPDPIDQGLLLYFQSPKSFTGEDMIEFHTHGGLAVKSRLLNALSKFETFREAEPGEFTRRALFNGKLDLLQAEALNDLINAESEAQSRLSIMQLQGRQSKIYEELRSKLLRMLAHVEAYIDFEADETSDITPEVIVKLREDALFLRIQIQNYLEQSQIGETIREGLKVAIVGPPNAGKSTLINLLAKRRVSIVSEVPGTTRDCISASMTLFGHQVTLTDTAGLRSVTTDIIEKEGIEIAKEELENAHSIVLVLDVTDLERVQESEGSMFKLSAEQESDIGLALNQQGKDMIVLLNKADLLSDEQGGQSPQIVLSDGRMIDASYVSFVSQDGSQNVDKVGSQLKEVLRKQGLSQDMISDPSQADNFLVTRHRHRVLLQQTATCLDNFLQEELQIDMAAEELRLGVQCVSRVTGHIDVEDMLDVLFSDFCIGK